MTSRTAAKPPKEELTRQRILNAAETVFAELGYAAARLEDVAIAVGIRRASIVYYFKNKQELYDAVEADLFAALEAATVASTGSSADPLQQLLAVFDTWLDFLVARPTAARIIMRDVADVGPRSQNPVEFSDSTLSRIENIVAAGQASGRFRRVNPMRLVSLIGGGINMYVCTPKLLGREREYSEADVDELEAFRGLLHTMVKAALLASDAAVTSR